MATIRDEGRIYAAAEDGNIPFVSTRDIAAVAQKALTDDKPHDTDHIILGSELYTYSEVRYEHYPMKLIKTPVRLIFAF
jgi:festuclavine dehydrogenase